MHPSETRAAVRAAYVHRRLPLAAAAADAGVSAGAARRWRREARAGGDDWDTARAASAMAGDAGGALALTLIENFVRLHETVIEDINKAEGVEPMKKAQALAMLADAFSKTMSAAGRVAPEISELAVAQDVIQRLGRFIHDKHPEHGPAFLQVLEPFALELAAHYG